MSFPDKRLRASLDSTRQSLSGPVIEIDVMTQRIFLNEFTAAKVAGDSLPQFFWKVTAEVTDHGSLVKELKATKIAFGCFFLIVNSFDVTFQCLVGFESFLTCWTRRAESSKHLKIFFNTILQIDLRSRI